MKQGWVTDRFQDVVFLQEGPGIRKYEYQNDGYPMINVRCVQDGFIDMTKSRSANYELATTKWKHFQIEEGDILFTISGTIGRSAIVKKSDLPLLMNTSVVRFRPLTNELDRRFLYHIVRGKKFQDDLINQSTGTAIKNVGPSHLKKITISYPPLPEQKCIVAKLDQAFEAIDKAKANVERNLQNAKDLFQSELNRIFSQKGDGWVEMTLVDVAREFGRGKSKHRPRNDKSLYNGGYPFVQTGDVRNAHKIILDHSQTYNEKGLAQSKLWEENTVCITIAANIAETAILNFKACFPDSIIGFIANPKISDNHYVYYVLQHFKEELKKLGKGSAQDNINLGTFENHTFPFPDVKTQQLIVANLDTLDEKVIRLESRYADELISLDELKKSILQKAFNGEL